MCAESFYRGRGYSAGDQYIFDCANGAGKTGNLGTWVYVDMNHHMTSTAIYLPRVLEQFTRGAPIERAIADTQ